MRTRSVGAALACFGTRGSLAVVREYIGSRAPLENLAAFCREWPYAYWYADPSGPQQIDELCRLGEGARKAHNAILPGIQRLTRLGNSGRLTIDEGLVELRREFGSYVFATESGAEIPVDANNHLLAALRYVVLTLPDLRQARPPPVQTDEKDAHFSKIEEISVNWDIQQRSSLVPCWGDPVRARNVAELSSAPRSIGKIFRRAVRVKTNKPCRRLFCR